MATPTLDGELQHRLREGRRGIGKTQQEVADSLGVTRRAVSEWETGLRRPHSKLPELAALYGVTTSYLLTGAEEASVEVRALREAVDELGEFVAEFAHRTTKNFEYVAALLGAEADELPEPPLANGARGRSRPSGRARTRQA